MVFAAPLFWNVQLIRVTVERNVPREGRRNRKTWYILIYGPRFTVGCNYFCKHGKQQLSLFDRHCQRLYTAWKNPFRSKGFTKEDYVSTFSSVSWDSLSELEKSSHSISKCFACAKMYANLQRFFPLSPTFEPDSSVIDTSNEKPFLKMNILSSIPFV